MEVRIENLTKTFVGKKGVETTAVSQMSFTIPDGKLVGLLGPSGCGKSTTLYMIAGLHKPTEGHIWFGDEDVTNLPPENRGIGLVFQNYALYPHLSVRQNIEFPLDNVRYPGVAGLEKNRVLDLKRDLKQTEKDIKLANKKFDKLNIAVANNEEKLADGRVPENKINNVTTMVEEGKKTLQDTSARISDLEKHYDLLQSQMGVAEQDYQNALAAYEDLKVSDPAKAREVAKTRLSKAEKDAIAAEMARVVDIEQFLDRKPKELSSGQQQRVAIARALAKSPRVLLLDEPLSNLDARLRLQTREEIKRIQRETGITTVFVTHDQEEAMSISDTIVVMKLGVIQQIDEPQKVYDEPANLFVAKFLGSPAINTFDGEIKAGKLCINGHPFDDDKAYAKGGDRPVVIAVRPEAFEFNPKQGRIPVSVAFVEHIGRDITIIGNVENQDKSKLKIIIPSELRDQILGQKKLIFRAKRFYVFEVSGERIK